MTHAFKFGHPDQGCQCTTCHRARLDEAAPALLEALDRLVALTQVASVEGLVINGDHPAILNARSALLRVQT